jgi:hypothetical protein
LAQRNVYDVVVGNPFTLRTSWALAIDGKVASRATTDTSVRARLYRRVMTSPFDIVLGIACHAVYHAGQVQLIKRLRIA